MILGARHVGFVVSDIFRSITFYEGLGFHAEGATNTETGASISNLVGIPNVTIRTIKLSLSVSDEGIWREGGFRIELVEYMSPTSLQVKFESNNFIGRGHMCLTVSSISQAIQVVVSLGGTAPFDPVLNDDGEQTTIYILDPDGIPIELSKNIR